MLIKPFVRKSKEVSINSLPSNTSYSPNDYHPAYFGTKDEHRESLEIEGRLLMLTTMYSEWNIRREKANHDFGVFQCQVNWSICPCLYARVIRYRDMGIKTGEDNA